MAHIAITAVTTLIPLLSLGFRLANGTSSFILAVVLVMFQLQYEFLAEFSGLVGEWPTSDERLTVPNAG